MTDEVVDATSWIAETFPTYNWQHAQLRIGAFHDVLIGQHGVVARVTRAAGHRARGVREAAIARTLDRIDLDIQIPHLLTEPVSDTHRTGYVMTRVAGSHHSPLDWPALHLAYRSLLRALGAASTELPLPPPRAWCGGDDFPRIVQHGLATSLGLHLDAAVAAVRPC